MIQWYPIKEFDFIVPVFYIEGMIDWIARTSSHDIVSLLYRIISILRLRFARYCSFIHSSTLQIDPFCVVCYLLLYTPKPILHESGLSNCGIGYLQCQYVKHFWLSVAYPIYINTPSRLVHFDTSFS